jgi:hypothetical protein
LGNTKRNLSIWDNTLTKDNNANLNIMNDTYQKVLRIEGGSEQAARRKFREVCERLNYPMGAVDRYLETTTIKTAANGEKTIENSIRKIEPDNPVNPNQPRIDEPMINDTNIPEQSIEQRATEQTRNETEDEVKEFVDNIIKKSKTIGKGTVADYLPEWLGFFYRLWKHWSSNLWRFNSSLPGWQKWGFTNGEEFMKELIATSQEINRKLMKGEPISTAEWKDFAVMVLATNRVRGQGPQAAYLFDELILNNPYVEGKTVREALQADPYIWAAYQGAKKTVSNTTYDPIEESFEQAMESLPIVRAIYRLIKLGRKDAYGNVIDIKFSHLLPNPKALLRIVHFKDPRSAELMCQHLMMYGRNRVLVSKAIYFVIFSHLVLPTYMAALKFVIAHVQALAEDWKNINWTGLCEQLKKMDPVKYNDQFCATLKMSQKEYPTMEDFNTFFKQSLPFDYFNMKVYEEVPVVGSTMGGVLKAGLFWTYWDEVAVAAVDAVGVGLAFRPGTESIIERALNGEIGDGLRAVGIDPNKSIDENIKHLKNLFTEEDKKAISLTFYAKHKCYMKDVCGQQIADIEKGFNGLEVIDWSTAYWHMIGGVKVKIEIQRDASVEDKRDPTSITGFNTSYTDESGNTVKKDCDCNMTCEQYKKLYGL